jgi:excinuclease UvrABC nuclease subunit
LYSSNVLPLDQIREFRPDDDEFFAALPARAGVFLIEMADLGAQPYLAKTADIRRAAERLLRLPDESSKRLNLRGVGARIRYRITGSKFEQTLALYGQARTLFPHKYRDRLRLRPPALLKVNLRNSYPRCYVTRGIRADEGFYLGPFPSRRAADAFNEGVLDLFKIRRCQIKIRRDPTFPGCVYSEMKMCMAPCFAGCTKEEYDADVAGLVSMLDSAGSALLDPLEREREAASEGLDFERAAGLHKRIEKIKAAMRLMPDVAGRIDKLDAVILQRGAEEKTVVIFPVRSGILAEPIRLNFAESDEPRSVEAIVRQALEPRPREDGDATKTEKAKDELTESEAEKPVESLQERYGLRAAVPELSEHLSLVGRWFYSNPREGEILFREGDWPYRRVLRACARLLAPEPPPEQVQAPSTEPNTTS